MRRLPIWTYSWLFLLLILALVATGPSVERHDLLHTLEFGRDTYGRNLVGLSLYAARFSLLFASLATGVALLLGLVLGCSIALSPKPIRFFAYRVLDFFLAFPSLLLALFWAALRGPGWDTLFISLAIGTVPSTVRALSARAEELMIEDYLSASHAMGAGRFHIAVKHLIPDLSSLCALKFPNLFCQALVAEATLSFLGVGAPIGSETWGSLLAQGQSYLLEAPHLIVFVGTPLFLTTLALQTISAQVTERPNQKTMLSSNS